MGAVLQIGTMQTYNTAMYMRLNLLISSKRGRHFVSNMKFSACCVKTSNFTALMIPLGTLIGVVFWIRKNYLCQSSECVIAVHSH